MILLKKETWYKFIRYSGCAILPKKLNKHNIIIPKVRIQTTLKFKCTDPWPEKEKLERDQAVIIWIIANQQPFIIVENEKFIQRCIQKKGTKRRTR